MTARTHDGDAPASLPPDDGRLVMDGAARLGLAVYAAAALSLAAATIHLWVFPEHLLMWWGYGAFFLAAGLAQGLYAVALLMRPTLTLLLAGIAGNLSVVAMYILTRTAGVPFGPQAGKTEEASLLDVAATAAEIGIVFALVTLLGGVARRRTINALLLLGAAVWVLRLTGVLL